MKFSIRSVLKDKVLVGVVGFGLLIVGSVGLFVAESDIGTTAAIVAGAAMFLLAVLVDRILLIKYGPYEIHLAQEILEAAEIAEEEGDETVAETLRGRGLDLLRRAEEGDMSHGAAIRKLYGMAREKVQEAAREALEEEGFHIERGLQTLMSNFSMIGVRGEEKIGVLIDYGQWGTEMGTRNISLGLHSTPGLKGVIVIQHVLSRRRQSDFPQPSLTDIERNIEIQFPGIKVRIVIWRPGDSVDEIRRAIRGVLT